MKSFNRLLRTPACILIIVLPFLQSCRNPSSSANKADSISIRKSITESPVLEAGAAIKKMHVEDGFVVKPVAAEPLIAAPVALSFDEKGRIWVVEMQDYMPDTVGTGEDIPSGKVIILSDKNGDGIMDDSQVFLDSFEERFHIFPKQWWLFVGPQAIPSLDQLSFQN